MTHPVFSPLVIYYDVYSMKINHAPHPNDIIWDNLAIPKSQINYRSFITGRSEL